MSIEEHHVVVAYAAVARDLEHHRTDLATQRAHLRTLTHDPDTEDDDAVYGRAHLMIADQRGEWETILRLTDRMTTTKVTIDQLTTAQAALWETKGGPATPPPAARTPVSTSYVYKRHEYATPPDLWAGDGFATRTALAEDVQPGDLFVFPDAAQPLNSHAWRVDTIDNLLPSTIPDETEPIFFRFNCTGGATAGAYAGDTVTLAVPTTGDHHP